MLPDISMRVRRSQQACNVGVKAAKCAGLRGSASMGCSSFQAPLRLNNTWGFRAELGVAAPWPTRWRVRIIVMIGGLAFCAGRQVH